VMYRLQQFVWDAIPCRNEVVAGRVQGHAMSLAPQAHEERICKDHFGTDRYSPVA